jgi:capsid protein
MQPHRTVDEALTPQRSASTLVTAPGVPQRSARRATARRASNRRATARLHKDDIEERVSEYLNHHPLCTTGDLAKALNADRAKVAAARSHIADENSKDHVAR